MQTTNASVTSFRLARMSPLILVITLGLLAVPLVFVARALLGKPPGAMPALLVVAIYAWIWLRFRPNRFVLHGESIEVIWPLKRVVIPREQISSVRLIDKQALRSEVGWGMRVGAGGLWGGFGWLWTSRRGIVQMYISRTDGLVWIERGSGRPWRITPERPEDFVRTLSGYLR